MHRGDSKPALPCVGRGGEVEGRFPSHEVPECASPTRAPAKCLIKSARLPRLGCGRWVPHPCPFLLPCPRPVAAGAALLGTPHLQEVPSLTVDGDLVVVDGDELLGLADEEGSAVQLRPVSSEGELALETQHVQAP